MRSVKRRWWIVGGVLLALLVVLAPRRVYTPTVPKPDFEAAGQAALEWRADEVVESVLLIGDTGYALPQVWDPFIEHLLSIPDRTTVVLMGDNVYEFGIPPEADPGHSEAVRRLNYQTDRLKAAGARAVFIPGNHDWNGDLPGGLHSIERQQEMVLKALGPNSFMPTGGCPGPSTVLSNERFQVIAIDSEWWMYRTEKPALDGTACPQSSSAELSNDITAALNAGAATAQRLIVMHHPIVSYGPHGLGTNCPGNAGCPAYKRFIEQLLAAGNGVKGLLCAAGHDHSLQVVQGSYGCELFLVSGTGSHLSRTRVGPDTLYALENHGFMRIDATKDGKMMLTVFVIDLEKRTVAPTFRKVLSR